MEVSADMLSGLRVSVLGTITRDTVFTSQGSKWEGFGGILYNLLGLSHLGGERITLYPVCNLGEDCYEEVLKVLSQVDNISCDGIRRVKTKNNHVIIRYNPVGEKKEILEGRVPPLRFEEVETHLEVDLLLVNFISGFDLDLETLKRIRQEFGKVIYMDLHSLTLGVDQQGRRFLRPIPKGDEWIAQVDILQLNRREAEFLWGGPLDGTEGFSQLGNRILSLGPFCLLVTLGSQGVFLLKGDTISHLPSPSQAVVEDPTGYGDLFTSGFIWEYLKSRDALKACKRANQFVSREGLISQFRSKMKRPKL